MPYAIPGCPKSPDYVRHLLFFVILIGRELRDFSPQFFDHQMLVEESVYCVTRWWYCEVH